MSILMSTTQRDAIREAFEKIEPPKAHKSVWSRRSYAPMHIHSSEFRSLRSQIYRALPQYEIAFDVLFESRGNTVGWHCDYESLGPFFVPNRWEAVKDSHFMTVHFNLTEDGGALTCLPWSYLSYFFYLVIASTGIFSTAHSILTLLFIPIFAFFARVHSNKPLHGNIFDNTRLHMVTAGKPRLSYVVRLVKKGGVVLISRDSIKDGVKRSDACEVFNRLVDHIPSADSIDAAAISWSSI